MLDDGDSCWKSHPAHRVIRSLRKSWLFRHFNCEPCITHSMSRQQESSAMCNRVEALCICNLRIERGYTHCVIASSQPLLNNGCLIITNGRVSARASQRAEIRKREMWRSRWVIIMLWRTLTDAGLDLSPNLRSVLQWDGGIGFEHSNIHPAGHRLGVLS